MYSFRSDYTEGAHPAVMQALCDTNLLATTGYGMDAFCDMAREKVKAAFACPDADVHFMVGGTITNLTVITAALRPWEAVIAAVSGHIAVHETGAIEAAGHKVCCVDAPDGKLTPEAIRAVVMAHRTEDAEHMVFPRMVYLSDATELGTVYTKAELTAIRSTCKELGLYLYLDGARLAAALVSKENDLTAEDLPQICDCFYVGGTKNGLLFGEAVVIVNDEPKPYFRNVIKQRGGMLAKGRLLGVQFGVFFENELWLDMARHAVSQAQRIQTALREKGYALRAVSPTNQIFPIVTNEQRDALLQSFDFENWETLDETHTVIRFVTSWATTDEAVNALIGAL